MSNKAMERMFQFKRFLGQEIGKIEPRLQETACMDLKSRQILAGLEIVEIWIPELKQDQVFQNIKETVKTQGYANWLRSEFTHLALKKGLPADQTESLENFDIEAITEENIS